IAALKATLVAASMPSKQTDRFGPLSEKPGSGNTRVAGQQKGAVFEAWQYQKSPRSVRSARRRLKSNLDLTKQPEVGFDRRGKIPEIKESLKRSAGCRGRGMKTNRPQ